MVCCFILGYISLMPRTRVVPFSTLLSCFPRASAHRVGKLFLFSYISSFINIKSSRKARFKYVYSPNTLPNVKTAADATSIFYVILPRARIINNFTKRFPSSSFRKSRARSRDRVKTHQTRASLRIRESTPFDPE